MIVFADRDRSHNGLQGNMCLVIMRQEFFHAILSACLSAVHPFPLQTKHTQPSQTSAKLQSSVLFFFQTFVGFFFLALIFKSWLMNLIISNFICYASQINNERGSLVPPSSTSFG